MPALITGFTPLRAQGIQTKPLDPARLLEFAGQKTAGVAVVMSVARIAQLVERRICNAKVGGSTPSLGTKFTSAIHAISAQHARHRWGVGLHSGRAVAEAAD